MSRTTAFIVLILLALLSAGCVPTSQATQSSAPTAQPLQTVAATPASIPPTAVPTQPAATATIAPIATQPLPALSADEVYKAVADAWAMQEKAGPRHVSQIAYKGNNAIMDIEADSVPPNYHQVVSSMGTVMAEQYIFDGTIYNKDQGVWGQVPGAGTTFKSTLAGFSQALSDQIIKSDGKVLGVEDVNGKPAFVYGYTTTLKELNASTQYTVSVDQASGLLVKQIIIDDQGMKTVQIITYDATITLTLPDEAKNAPILPN